MRSIHVIGIGAGDPDFVTVQAIAARERHPGLLAMDKGEAKSDLMSLRREVCRRFITRPDYRFVELPDPVRAVGGDYAQSVADWHPARTKLWANAIEKGNPARRRGRVPGLGILRCTTARWILDEVARHVDLRYDVIPGITAVQVLTARHRIPLNEVGEPVLITTGRRLRASGLTGSAAVLLDGNCAFLDCPPQTRIWWVPISAPRTNCWSPVSSARWAEASPSYGRRLGSAMAG